MGFYGGVQLDGDQLARTLEEIGSALGRPSIVPPTGSTLGHDRAEILASIEAVLAAAGGDLATKHTLAAVAQPFAPTETAHEARSVLDEIDAALAKRVAARLGSERCQVLARRLKEPVPDVLSIFRKQLDENAHSDLIAWLLDVRTAETVAPIVLRALADRLGPPDLGVADRAAIVAEWRKRIDVALRDRLVSVRREYVYGREWEGSERLDRIDIVVLGPDFTIAIENKVRAGEHNEQTLAYWTWLASLPRAWLPGNPERPFRPEHHFVAGLMLSPNGAPAASRQFISLSALDFVGCLLDAADEALSAAERVVLGAYLKTAATVLLRAEARAADRVGGAS